jgi:hypothetical protein
VAVSACSFLVARSTVSLLRENHILIELIHEVVLEILDIVGNNRIPDIFFIFVFFRLIFIIQFLIFARRIFLIFDLRGC